MSKNGPFPNYRNSRRNRGLLLRRKREMSYEKWNELMNGGDGGDGTVAQEKIAAPVVKTKESLTPISREREIPLRS